MFMKLRSVFRFRTQCLAWSAVITALAGCNSANKRSDAEVEPDPRVVQNLMKQTGEMATANATTGANPQTSGMNYKNSFNRTQPTGEPNTSSESGIRQTGYVKPGSSQLAVAPATQPNESAAYAPKMPEGMVAAEPAPVSKAIDIANKQIVKSEAAKSSVGNVGSTLPIAPKMAPVHSRPALPLENPLPPDFPSYGSGSPWSPPASGAAWTGPQLETAENTYGKPVAPGFIAPVAPTIALTQTPASPVVPVPAAVTFEEPKLPAPVANEQPQRESVARPAPNFVPSATDPNYPFEVPPLPTPQQMQR